MSTREVVDHWLTSRKVKYSMADRQFLIEAIDEAMRKRDERAARIIKEHRESDICRDNCWTTITDLILRKDDTQQERENGKQ